MLCPKKKAHVTCLPALLQCSPKANEFFPIDGMNIYHIYLIRKDQSRFWGGPVAPKGVSSRMSQSPTQFSLGSWLWLPPKKAWLPSSLLSHHTRLDVLVRHLLVIVRAAASCVHGRRCHGVDGEDKLFPVTHAWRLGMVPDSWKKPESGFKQLQWTGK